METPHRAPPTCPICTDPLRVEEQGGVELARCTQHGIFLEHSECQQLVKQAGAAVRRDLHRRMRDVEADVNHGTYTELFGETIAAPGPPLDNDEAVPAGQRPCPYCGEVMDLEKRADLWKQTPVVTVDTCPDHGVWLDQGELQILLHRAQLDADRLARARFSKRRGDAEYCAVTKASALGLLVEALFGVF